MLHGHSTTLRRRYAVHHTLQTALHGVRSTAARSAGENTAKFPLRTLPSVSDFRATFCTRVGSVALPQSRIIPACIAVVSAARNVQRWPLKVVEESSRLCVAIPLRSPRHRFTVVVSLVWFFFFPPSQMSKRRQSDFVSVLKQLRARDYTPGASFSETVASKRPSIASQTSSIRGRSRHRQRCCSLLSLPTFDPTSRAAQWWDSSILLLVVLSALVTPIRLSFDVELSATTIAFNVIMNCLFLADVVKTLNTRVYEGGQFITDRSTIVKRYARRWMLMDLVWVVPLWLVESSSSTVQVMLFLRVLRLVRLRKIWTTGGCVPHGVLCVVVF